MDFLLGIISAIKSEPYPRNRHYMVERQVKLLKLLAEDYIAIIQQDYLEKLYFYALKKTGNKHEAEDLAQDIAAQAIMSLMNGSTPSISPTGSGPSPETGMQDGQRKKIAIHSSLTMKIRYWLISLTTLLRSKTA